MAGLALPKPQRLQEKHEPLMLPKHGGLFS